MPMYLFLCREVEDYTLNSFCSLIIKNEGLVNCIIRVQDNLMSIFTNNRRDLYLRQRYLHSLLPYCLLAQDQCPLATIIYFVPKEI